jgi:hypothetical protein
MSIIHINLISKKIKDLFESHLDLTDISDKDSDKESKIISRCLAAYSIYLLIDSSDSSIKEAAEAVTDGGDDNGIDAIYYSPTNRRMIITQSKWIKDGKSEPDVASINKFCNGVKDIFLMNFDRFNDKVRKKESLITKALTEYGTKWSIVLIDTGEKASLSKHSQHLIDDLLKELNSAGETETEEIVEFIKFNQGQVYSSFASGIGDSPINLEIALESWGMINNPHRAYYGMLSAKEIAKWWEDYQRKLFNKNIRQVLGSTDVNKEIEETLIKNSDKFWYYNNGITIIADKIQKTMVGGGTHGFGTFKLDNVSIVNGAQTVSTIGKYALKENSNLDNVKVHVRIISLKDTSPEFGKDVTRANNRQNRIENRDFVSQDPEQVRLKTELAIEGIEYSIVRSDLFKSSDKAFDLNEATVALACASGNSNLSTQAKGAIGKFYEDLNSSIYKRLFNPNVHGVYVYNCVRVDRKINDIIRETINKLPIKSGRNYGLLIHGNRLISLLVMKALSLKGKMNSMSYTINDNELEDTTQEVINRVSIYLETNYKDSILGSLFKNNTKCDDIVQNALISN